VRLGRPHNMPPPHLDFWLFDLKSVWESHVTWGTPMQSFVFLGLLVFELEPMYATSDRQTDGQTDGRTDGRTTDADDRLMPPPPLRGRGHNNLATNTRAIIVSKEQQTRDSSADKIDERYRLNHAIVVHVQAACQAVVCGTMCLQAACLRNPYIWRHRAIYGTSINTALNLLGVGSNGTFAYELKILKVTQGRSRSFEITPMRRVCVSY